MRYISILVTIRTVSLADAILLEIQTHLKVPGASAARINTKPPKSGSLVCTDCTAADLYYVGLMQPRRGKPGRMKKEVPELSLIATISGEPGLLI